MIHANKVTTNLFVSSKFVNYDSIFAIGKIDIHLLFDVVVHNPNRPKFCDGARSYGALAMGIEATCGSCNGQYSVKYATKRVDVRINTAQKYGCKSFGDGTKYGLDTSRTLFYWGENPRPGN